MLWYIKSDEGKRCVNVQLFTVAKMGAHVPGCFTTAEDFLYLSDCVFVCLCECLQFHVSLSIILCLRSRGTICIYIVLAHLPVILLQCSGFVEKDKFSWLI